MPNFVDHINKAIHNFKFLEQVNLHIPNSIDWQITVCYYTSLHLINAHLANFGVQYRKHKDVQNILNPGNPTSLAKIDTEPFVKYRDLELLSRKSRYMTHGGNPSPKPAIVTAKHLANAIAALDVIIVYFKVVFEKKKHTDGDTLYSFAFPSIELECSELKEDLIYITKRLPIIAEN